MMKRLRKCFTYHMLSYHNIIHAITTQHNNDEPEVTIITYHKITQHNISLV